MHSGGATARIPALQEEKRMNPGNPRVFLLGLGRAALLAVLVAAGIGAAGATIRIELDFTAPTASQREDGSVFVSAPECVTLNEPGLPLLPARGTVVLLPPPARP